jgi:hypothetical protein
VGGARGVRVAGRELIEGLEDDRRRIMRRTISLGLVALAAIACGSSPTTEDGFNPGGKGGGGGGDLGGGGTGDLGGGGGGGGGGGDTCAATVASAQAGQVDIIFVIDTSGSMTEEIIQTQQNINNFAQTIGNSGLDYQVIMIGTRGTSGNAICVPAPLGGAGCADNPPRFRHVPQNVGSTNSLALILTTYDTAWNSFVRPSATKVFIEITDDNSNLNFQTFDQQLLAKQPAGMFGDANNRKYIFDSICGWQDGTPVLSGSKCGSAVNIGSQYQNLSNLTKGIVDSVCKTSYAGVFNNIAKGVVSKLGCEFQMPKSNGQPTDPTKVVVQYTPAGQSGQKLTQVTDAGKCGSVNDGWYYDDNNNPTKIVLCPTMCTNVGNTTGGKMEVLLGCKAPPPR